MSTVWFAVFLVALSSAILWYSKHRENRKEHVMRGTLEEVGIQLANLRGSIAKGLTLTVLSVDKSDEQLRREMVEAWSRSFECRISVPDRLDWIDGPALARLTEQFGTVGLRHDLDYELHYAGDAEPAAFCRCMTHPHEGCTASISFHREIPECKAVIAVSTDFRDGSRFTAWRRDGTMVDYLLRHPKRLVSFVATGTPQELFSAHLRQRALLVAEKGLEIRSPLARSIEDVKRTENEEMWLRQEQSRRLNFREAIKEAVESYPGATWEWLGK